MACVGGSVLEGEAVCATNITEANAVTDALGGGREITVAIEEGTTRSTSTETMIVIPR